MSTKQLGRKLGISATTLLNYANKFKWPLKRETTHIEVQRVVWQVEDVPKIIEAIRYKRIRKKVEARAKEEKLI